MKYKVLIVDDSISVCNTLKSLIESDFDIDIFIAKSMKESANLLLQEKGKFDIVLADLGLPDAPDGEIIDFLSKFKIPIVILTGTESIDIEEKFRDKNIVDYIIKDGLSALTYATSIVKRIMHNKDIKVLVVDDSKLFVDKSIELLSRYKIVALSAYDGDEAFETLKQNSDIKIVLTDYLMPKMNGLELTKRIRKDYSKDELSIIVTSNDSSKKIPAKFLKYGANDFLYKGFSNEEFFARINSNIEILELFDEIKNKANKDYLTGLYNRRYLFDIGNKLYEDCKLNNKTFAIAIIDIDNFKNINDTYGHDIGDIALKEVSKVLNNNISSNALISRLGGEEFCICFYNRSESEITELLEYIRKEFENNVIKIGKLNIQYTISIGYSLEFGKNIDCMIQNADKYLYLAKKEGRNRVRRDESRFT
ncbi:MAG: diguanylate cyclase [Arcobacter sp.]|uniref:diguanylate cyclase n=1 Tax=Arcobacter defluvii TaxID=873191 RepID=A0AAE7E7K2_9BACT|nr:MULTISPECIES: diguanylate cyclase [Arcobacter]QKF78577.1 response regulator receiver-modulated diguanylate cyclase [Arcobacter defluvii]RXI29174.1 diguanylate cyclase response regulator [Arcobacter defluvii]BAK74360.1 diguanylate cyclase [Arcobacter sp. L]